MPSSDNHGSSLPFASFRRSIMTLRPDQVHAAETSHVATIENLDSFQKQIFSHFHELSIATSEDLLSLAWISKLLDTFTSCQEDFRLILSDNKALLSKPISDKLTTEYFDRAIKAMDILNATRDGIQTIRLWQKHIEIIVCALNPQQHKSLGEGHFRRSRKALMDLALVMLDVKDTGSVFSHRNRSFNRKGKDHVRSASGGGHTRSLSWSVSNNWSASKQLQFMANSLFLPRASDIAATNGLATVVFTMGFVLMFVLWVLVAAIPCQDRGVQINFSFPRQFEWSSPMLLIHNRIMDEFKKRDRRHSCGLLKEIYQIEKSVHQLTDLVDNAQFPLSDEVKEEVRVNVDELSTVCEVCKTGLDPLERKLREVFRKVMYCRTEGLEFLGKATEP